MEFVVDANVVLAAILRDSFTRRILLDPLTTLYAPEVLRNEVKNQFDPSNRFRKRLSRISQEQLETLVSVLFSRISIVPYAIYRRHYDHARTLAPHLEDAAYLAVALLVRLPIWSNDTGMKQQDEVQVVTTEELVKI